MFTSHRPGPAIRLQGAGWYLMRTGYGTGPALAGCTRGPGARMAPDRAASQESRLPGTCLVG